MVESYADRSTANGAVEVLFSFQRRESQSTKHLMPSWRNAFERMPMYIMFLLFAVEVGSVAVKLMSVAEVLV